MARNLDISLLRTFATVSDQRSMTRASEILHVTQGAISQQIARLEALVGIALIARDPRGLRLTLAGERFLERVRPLVTANDEVWSEIESGGVSGPVRLGLPFDLVTPCFAPTLKSYCEAFPKVELSLVCASSPDLLQMMQRGRLDLAIVEEAIDAVGGEVLAIDRLVWVGAPSGQAHKRSPLPVSLVAESCVFQPAVSAALAEQKLTSRMVFETGGLDAARTVVRMDLAISAWLASSVPADLDIISDTGLPPLPSFAITLYRANSSRCASIDELARQLRNAAARPRLVA